MSFIDLILTIITQAFAWHFVILWRLWALQSQFYSFYGSYLKSFLSFMTSTDVLWEMFSITFSVHSQSLCAWKTLPYSNSEKNHTLFWGMLENALEWFRWNEVFARDWHKVSNQLDSLRRRRNKHTKQHSVSKAVVQWGSHNLTEQTFQKYSQTVGNSI